MFISELDVWHRLCSFGGPMLDMTRVTLGGPRFDIMYVKLGGGSDI